MKMRLGVFPVVLTVVFVPQVFQSVKAWGGPWGGNMFGIDMGQSTGYGYYGGPYGNWGGYPSYGGWGGYPGYGYSGYSGYGYGYPAVVAPATPTSNGRSSSRQQRLSDYNLLDYGVSDFSRPQGQQPYQPPYEVSDFSRPQGQQGSQDKNAGTTRHGSSGRGSPKDKEDKEEIISMKNKNDNKGTVDEKSLESKKIK